MRQILSLASALVLSACADRPRESEEDALARRRTLPRELVGCWALYAEDGERVDTSYHNAAPVVRLEGTHLHPHPDTQPDMLRRAVALDTLGRTMRGSGGVHGVSWAVNASGDSVRVSFVDGFSGAIFTFSVPERRGDTMRGWAEEHWDFGPAADRGRASAVRVQCPR